MSSSSFVRVLATVAMLIVALSLPTASLASRPVTAREKHEIGQTLELYFHDRASFQVMSARVATVGVIYNPHAMYYTSYFARARIRVILSSVRSDYRIRDVLLGYVITDYSHWYVAAGAYQNPGCSLDEAAMGHQNFDILRDLGVHC